MFVRTKEKVYEVVEENERYYKCCYDDGRITLVAKFDNDVNGFSKALKIADTIEELCDEFVIVNGKIHQTTKALNKIKEYFNPYDTFYGAVWCEWGLKYVAKLDDKGEFQLL